MQSPLNHGPAVCLTCSVITRDHPCLPFCREGRRAARVTAPENGRAGPGRRVWPALSSLLALCPRYSLRGSETLSQQECSPHLPPLPDLREDPLHVQPRPIRWTLGQTGCSRAGVASVTRNVPLAEPRPGSASHLVPITSSPASCLSGARGAREGAPGGKTGQKAQSGP